MVKELIITGFEKGHGLTFIPYIGGEPKCGIFLFWNKNKKKNHEQKG